MTEQKTEQKTVQSTVRKTVRGVVHGVGSGAQVTGKWFWQHKGPFICIVIGMALGGRSLNTIVKQLIPK